MDEELDIEYSPLGHRLESEGKCIHVVIFRINGSDWVLKVEDEYANSTIWYSQFDSDEEALEEAKKTVQEEGIDFLIRGEA